MDSPPPDLSYVDVFRERSAEFAAKSEDAQSTEAKQAFLDLATMYQNMANSSPNSAGNGRRRGAAGRAQSEREALIEPAFELN